MPRSAGLSSPSCLEDAADIADAVFRIELALDLERTLAETAQIGSLVQAKLYWQLRALVDEWSRWLHRETIEELGDHIAARTAWADALREHTIAIGAADEARTLLEQRYLDGHAAVFPITRARLDRQRQLATAMAEWWTKLTGPQVEDRADPADVVAAVARLDLSAIREEVHARARTRADAVVLAARVSALDVVGDVHGALALLATTRTEDRRGPSSRPEGRPSWTNIARPVGRLLLKRR